MGWWMSTACIVPFRAIRNTVGVWKNKVIANTYGGVIALDRATPDTGEVIPLRGPNRCCGVWGEHLLSIDQNMIRIWKLEKGDSPETPQIELEVKEEFEVAGASAMMILRDSMLVGLSNGDVMECSIDGDHRKTMYRARGKAFAHGVISMVEWKDCIFSGHSGNMVNMYDAKSKVLLRSMSTAGYLNIWKGRLVSSQPHGYRYSVWNVCTWSTDIHSRYPPNVHNAIHTFILCCRKDCPKDIVLLISSMIAGTFSIPSMVIESGRRPSRYNGRTKMQ